MQEIFCLTNDLQMDNKKALYKSIKKYSNKGGGVVCKKPLPIFKVGKWGISREKEKEAKMDGTLWELVTFRCDPDTKEALQHWCLARHLPLSVLLRLVAQRLIVDAATMPSAPKDPIREVANAVQEVDSFVPAIVKQRQVNPRMY